jgi:hypothetical protein
MTTKGLLWILPALLIASETAWTQKPAAPDPSLITVRMSRAAGPPDGRVSMPLALTAAKAGGKIGTLQLDVTFPTALLTFTGAETAGLSDGVSAAMKTDTRPDANDAATTHALVSLSTLGSSGQPLPDGTLVYLLFQISKDAKLSTLIPVGVAGTAVSTDAPPKSVEPITVQGNSVEVAESAVISCFFYMH